MTSLRRRLLLSSSLAVAIVGLICATVAYRQVSNQTRALLDNQLMQIARLAARTVDGSEIQSGGDEDILVAVWSADRKLKFSTAAMDLPLLPSGFTEVVLKAEPYRLYSTVIGDRHIAVAQPVDIRDDQAEAAALAAFLPLLILIPVLAVVLALVIRAQLKPVRKLAAQVAQRDPFERAGLEASGLPAEVLPLVDEINRLLSRQNAAAQRERQFVTDAAHALRTPLAALQLQAEVLEGAASPEEYAARFTDLRAGVRRAAHLSDQLLSVARSTSAQDPDPPPLEVAAVLGEVVDLYRPAALAAGVVLLLRAGNRTTVRADSRRLLLIFGNLVDNALRYTPAGGQIELRAQRAGSSVQVEVRDQGPGLAATELTRVFEPFYRAAGDPGGGSGLGLATVANLVTELGGQVQLRNRDDRSGLLACITLPSCVAGQRVRRGSERMPDFHVYEPRDGHGLAHDPLNSIVAPRPIGWISTRSASGVHNLAPYSFFNLFNYKPPIIGFASIGWKDSVANIKATGEFAWNLVTGPLAEAMNATSATLPAAQDEFEIARLTPAPSRLIRAPRVAESPVSFECRLSQLMRLTDAKGTDTDTWLTLGEVVAVHIHHDLIRDGVYDTAAAAPILRGGGAADYFRLDPNSRFQMWRPKP